MTSKNSVQVAIKVRPLLKKEKDLIPSWRVVNNSIQLTDSHLEPFYFDHIFDQSDSNQVVFDKMAKQIVHSSVQGFNGTIFAYGQTSSGKTYTMMGDEGNPGVMVLAAKEIFKEIERATDRQFVLRVGYIEIYNEKIFDLLNKDNQDLKIHETPSGIVSVNCEEFIITCEEDLLHYLCLGNKERTVGETNMNEHSSRSHAIFRIILESRKMNRNEDDAITQSVLNLVDLAGSERADQTGARGARLKEGGHINKSLLFLSNVIKRLSENVDNKYISYRDSKLTRILQASLGGNALTSIICTIKLTAIEETQSTLNFALRAKIMKNKPQVNEIISDSTMMKRLEREIKELKNCLAEERLKNQSQKKVGQLEQQIENEVLKIISSTSLNSIRTQRENRRRTWCPATSNISSALPLPKITESTAIPTRIQRSKNFLTPLITCRGVPETNGNVNGDSNSNANGNGRRSDSSSDLPIDEFIPGEEFDLQMRTPDASPKAYGIVTLTPSSTSITSKLQAIEQELKELQEFTHLENKIDVQHELYQALKQQMEELVKRNTELENERIEFMQHNLENVQNMSSFDKRCADYVKQIDELTALNRNAAERVNECDRELEELRTRMQQLEIENRNAVSLEFEFERHKNKFTLRETELLEALAEKDKEISNLEKSLQKITDDNSQMHAKDKLSQLASARDERVVGGAAVTGCMKCKDLERLLEENSKVKSDFEMLTVEYKQLQESYNNAKSDAATAQDLIAQLQRAAARQTVNDEETDKLRAEIVEMRKKLVKVLQEHTRLNSDRKAQSECHDLNQIVLTAKEELRVLQEKYDKLESLWLDQQQTISNIQAEYSAIESKYHYLQEKYEKLESTSTQSLEECARLQLENMKLQAEIVELKGKVEVAQKKLLEGTVKEDPGDDWAAKMRIENEEVRKELIKLQSQLQEIQTENDDLSNQLMDSLQDGEQLRRDLAKLELQLKKFQELEQSVIIKSEKTEHVSIKMEPLESNDWGSILSSGVGMSEVKEEEQFVSLPPRFVELINALEEIELEYRDGSSRTFASRLPLEGDKLSASAAFKLRLSNLQGITADTEDAIQLEHQSRVHMRGIIKDFQFCIVELEKLSAASEPEAYNIHLIEELRRHKDELEQENNSLICENKSIIETTERTVAELREQIERLSAELHERTLSMEKCSCEEYQKQIEKLQLECQKLLAKYSELEVSFKKDDSTASGENDANETLSGVDVSSVRASEIDDLRSVQADLHRRIAGLEAELEAQRDNLKCKIDLVEALRQQKDELEQSCLAAEANLNALRVEHEEKTVNAQCVIDDLIERMRSKEQEFQNECRRLKLDWLEKLENMEGENRLNMRKYNQEWQKSKEQYEHQIKNMEIELESLRSSCECGTLRCLLEDKQNQAIDLAMKLDHCQKELANNRLFAMNIDNLQETVMQLQEEQSEWNSEKLRLLNENKQLQKDNDQLRYDHDKLNASTAPFIAMRAQMEQTIHILEDRMADSDARMSKLSNVNAELGKTLQKLQEECDTIRSDFDDMQKDKRAIAAQRDEFKRSTVKLQKEIDGLTESCATLRSEAAALTQKCDSLTTERDELQCKLQRQAEDQRSVNEQDAVQRKRCEELQARVETLLNENKDLKESINVLKVSLSEVEEEKQQLSQHIASLETIQASNAEQLQQTQNEKLEYEQLIEKLRAQVNELDSITQENTSLQNAMEELKAKYEQALNELQSQKDALISALDAKKLLEQQTSDQLETLKLKEADLIQELERVRAQVLLNESKLSEHEKLAESLGKIIERGLSLDQIIEQIASVNSVGSEMNDLREELRITQEQRSKTQQERDRLEAELSELREELRTQRLSMQKQQTEMKSAVHEWRSRYDVVDEAKKELEKKNLEITAKLKAATDTLASTDMLQAELKQLRKQHLELKGRVEASVEPAAKVYELEMKLMEQKKLLASKSDANLTLRGLLLKKESKFNEDKERLEGTISCLLAEKKCLEEQLHAIQSTVMKLKSDHSSANAVASANAQRRRTDNDDSAAELNLSVSPRPRKNQSRLSIEGQAKSLNSPLEEKMADMPSKTQQLEMERKNRRISTHDERRRYSFWGDNREVACMTDPTDRNCNCIELDKKLKENERSLYICQSQVAVLNMELKNNPLKIENAELRKRLQEEQLKASTEIQRYKEIIVEQRMKAVTQVNELAQQQQEIKEEPKQVSTSDAEAQTESQLEELYKKLESKYNDVKNVCQFRYNVIKTQEQKLAEKENTNGNVPSSLELGQVKALKSQIETSKNELRAYKQKYEDAKQVLESRRLEIERLKAQLGKTSDNI